MKTKILSFIIGTVLIGGYIAYAQNGDSPEDDQYITKKEFEEAKVKLKREIKEELLIELNELNKQKEQVTDDTSAYFPEDKDVYYPGEEFHFSFLNDDPKEYKLHVVYRGDVLSIKGMDVVIRGYEPRDDHYIWKIYDSTQPAKYEAYIEKNGVKLATKFFTVISLEKQ